MELQTISQMSKNYGVSVRMLRYYDEIGLIKSIRKDDNGYRFYDETAIKQLHLIILLRKSLEGFRAFAEWVNKSEKYEIADDGRPLFDECLNFYSFLKGDFKKGQLWGDLLIPIKRK